MDKDIEFLDAAIDEARDAREWYAERSPHAAARFQQELDRAIGEISDDSRRFPEYVHGTRYYQLRRFPYIVVFLDSDTAIRIIAVAHTHRREGYWKDRAS